MSNWNIRVATRSEEIPSFVVESWLASYRRSPWSGVIPNNLYNAVYSDTIRQLLERGALVWIAHNPSNPNHVLGYLVSEFTSDNQPVVHTVFVKDLYRGAGVDIDLFAAVGIDPDQRFFYTFKTPAMRKYRGGKHEPAIARRKAA